MRGHSGAVRASVRTRDDGTALILVMMMIMVATSMSILLLAMVVTQAAPTLREQKQARTVHAAEAGVHAMVSQIRAAVTANGQGVLQGDRSKLPCGPLTGTVGGEQGGIGYTVTVSYFASDPTNTSAVWRTANAMACLAGYGPQYTPAYALVQAQGTGAGAGRLSAANANRELETVYDFQLTNQAIPGGLIKNLYGGITTPLLCVDAGSASPASNAVVKAVTCNSGTTSQLFAYQSNYSLVLTSTQTVANPAGMCITYDALQPTLVMRTCDGSNSQKWAFTSGSQFQYPWSGLCMKATNSSISGSSLVANGPICADTSSSNTSSLWIPDSAVGAGNAGPAQNQLVNFQQFGRCFDVTNFNLNSTFMIAWPCKQDPTSSPGWNQVVPYDTVTKHLVVNSTYCVTAPAANNGYVTTTPCVNGQANQAWTVTGNTGNYGTSYTIVDFQGRCLDLGPATPWTTGGVAVASIVSATCSGTTGQKWNAPANLTPAALTGTRETTG